MNITMRSFLTATLVLVTLAALLESTLVVAKKSSRPARSASAPRPPSQGGNGRRSSSSASASASTGKRPPSGRAPVSRRRAPVFEEDPEEEFEEEEDEALFDDEFDEEEEEDFFGEEDEPEILKPVSPKKGRSGGGGSRRPAPASRTSRDAPIQRGSPSSSRKRGPPASRSRFEEDDEEDFRRPAPRSRGPPPGGKPNGAGRGRGPPPSRNGRRPSGRSGSVVPYSRPGSGYGASLTKGFTAFRSSLPDPTAVRNVATASFNAARETTSGLSANIYREVKGLTSSELEQVMLKATRPDDTPVKGKHVERLVGVTYQISARYDIYDAVLRKLWGKMAEKDWRSSIKALYILHRFSSDGAPEHAPALKARLRELRRTRDPKRKDKFFNSKQLLAGDAKAENFKFRAFMSRYAHYVLLRTQCFGGMFDEISTLPKVDKKKAPKPCTSTTLRAEHLEAAAMLLKAGVACQLKDGEECENTAIAAERVASDLIGLTSAVAIALNRAFKGDDLKGADPVLLKKWCEFYSKELLPQTRAMIKKTSPKLDAYGLFLPSRMGTSVAPEVLQRGLHLEEETPSTPLEEEEEASLEAEESTSPVEVKKESKPTPVEEESAATAVEEEEEETAVAVEEEEEVEEEAEAEFDDEYEYDEEEYYDDEEL